MTTAVGDEPMVKRDGEGTLPGLIDAAAFEIVREVGRGGMATIYLAREKAPPHREVALKVIHPHLSGDPHLVERFKHEVRAHVGLAHPCIVEMLGWGHDARGRLFMAMEFVDGVTLKELLARRRPLPADLAVHVAACMASGLHAAHVAGIVHRDVKPANVMVTRDGRVKIADFGISKTEDMTRLTSTGNVIGTPAYMSPEQALGKPVDARSDLFSLGVVLYEMLVGANPFQADNPATTLSRVVSFRQRRAFEIIPQTPPLLEEVLEGLLAKPLEARWSDALETAGRLERCAAEEGLAASDSVLASYVEDPEGVGSSLDRARAQRHFDVGLKLYRAGGKEGAVWHLFLATLLDPSSASARTWLEQVSSERGYTLQRKPNARIDELEAKLSEDPGNLPLILQLAKLHKSQGSFLQVIYYYKRAKALRPPDRYTQGQIETLLSPAAVPLIDGGSLAQVTETLAAAPSRAGEGAQGATLVAARSAAAPAEVARGFFHAGFVKAAAVAVGLLGCILVAGFGFDAASRAAAPARGAAAVAPEDLDVDRIDEGLARARKHEESGAHARAETVLRGLLSSGAGPAESEALYLLGDCLERQGKREAAKDTHARNAAEHASDWAARSAGRIGELLLLDGDLPGARTAYEDMARLGSGQVRVEAGVELAGITRKEGRPEAAVAEYEALLDETDGVLHDVARLDLADTLASMGRDERARQLYAEVRDSTDHQGDAYRRAVKSLATLAPHADGDATDDTAVAHDETGAAEEPDAEAAAASEAPAVDEEEPAATKAGADEDAQPEE